VATERYAIVGASAAGVSAALACRQAGFRGQIVVVGAERYLPYERPPLSKTLVDETFVLKPIVPEDLIGAHEIQLRLGVRARSIDASARAVVLDDGERLSAEAVMLATGASPRRLAVPGSDLEGVHCLRDADDARALGRRLGSQAPLVVIGAGFIGLEFAAVARALGREVTVVEALSQPLLRAVGPQVGSVFAALHREQGVRLLLGTGVAAFRGAGGQVEAVELSDGQVVPAGMVVVGIGVRPETALAEMAGAVVDDGVLVDEHGRSSVPWLFAAGDVTSRLHVHCARRMRIEHWNNALYQGAAVGATMAGRPSTDDSVPYFWSDQYDVKLQMFGRPEATDEVVLRGDPVSRSATFFWLRGRRLVAAASMNRPREANVARRLIEKGATIDAQQLADESVDLRRLRPLAR
jgi:3-phenylpropionate/trans-cinnamate dioxygenase ferredoxin reductase component